MELQHNTNAKTSSAGEVFGVYGSAGGAASGQGTTCDPRQPDIPTGGASAVAPVYDARTDAFNPTCNDEAAPFEWTEVNFRAKSLGNKYSNFSRYWLGFFEVHM